MFHLALWEPEIPPNAGNVARLCAATNTTLHFIGRLGFRLDDKTLKRAGLDYWPHVKWMRHETWDQFCQAVTQDSAGPRLWLVDNPAPVSYTQVRYQRGDCLVFGSESKGLPAGICEKWSHRQVSIPMPNENVRSLNLATSAGIVLYEALRQQHDW
ncbi:MAG: tRNA (cytidine(34)-2'-O)-methyltransferase [Gemmataceae bacterium]